METDINKSVSLKYLGVGRHHHLLVLVVALSFLLDCGLYYPLIELRGVGFVGVVLILSCSGIEISQADHVRCL